jgi:predicted ATPase/class 3 adenylate cyclase
VGGLPSGTVTFLFTDIEGSTQLWERQEAEMNAALARHDEIMRDVIARHDGYVFSTSGDSFAAVFDRAGDALAAVRAVQERLEGTVWPTREPVKVRMGLHTGEAHERDGNYFGPVVNRAARIMAAGHGGQAVVSSTTAAIVGSEPLVDLGEHRLKDLGSVERLFQLDAPAGRFPPLRSLSAVRNNLPVPRTSLFGREAEIQRVLELLATGRLVTLTGVGGVGKTRLAMAAAAEAVDEFVDGVFFADLIPVTSPDQLVGQIADAVGLERGLRPEERLFDYLSDRRVLVILDNCEHVVDAVADLVDRVLDAGGQSHLLATSREELEVEGERTLRVGSLAVESVGAPGPAVALLLERADALDVTLRTPDELKAIVQICERLDGIPLAIELATAQLVYFSPNELLERLDRRFDLLAGGRRRRRQRQQTLQGVMDWSWELLDDVEQALLSRLAVFTGVFGLDAVEGICGDVDDAAVVVGALVSKSLVERLDGSDTARFRLLETVRLYSQQQLADRGEADDLQNRHLRWYVDRCRGDDFALNMLSLEHVSWYRRSFDNVLAAIEWALSSGDHDAAATLVAAGASQMFGQIGYIGQELVDVAERLLDLVDDPATRARLLVTQAWMGWAAYDIPLIHRASDRAVEAARRADDSHALVMALATATFFRNDRRHWEANLAEARAVAASTTSWAAVDLVDAFLVGAHYEWADMERAAIDAPRRVKRHDVITVMDLANLTTTSAAAVAIGDLPLAAWAIDERAALSREFDLPENWGESYDQALIAAFGGDADRARRHLDHAWKAERSGRVGPARGEFLLVPALLADLDDRPHDCAVLLAIVRTNPVPMIEGHSVAIYRQLRRRTTEALTEEQLIAARSEAERATSDGALAEFLLASHQ